MQRKLLGALVAAFVVAGLMLVPMMASGQSGNCPAGYDHKSDPPVDITKEWGTATLVSGGSAVEFYVKDGYTVDVCVKGGNEGFTEDTIVGEATQTVSTPTEQDVSHYEWTVSTTPPTTTVPEETTTVPEETTTTQPTTTTTVAPTTTTTVAATTSTEAPTTTTTEPTTTTTVAATSSSEDTTDSTLPFTGPPNTGLLVVAGLALLALGAATLRVSSIE